MHVLVTNANAGGAHGRHVDLSLPNYHEVLHRTVRLVSSRVRGGPLS